MKKSKLAPRNPLVCAALFKKSGAHQKTNKALRRRENQMTQKTAADCGRFVLGLLNLVRYRALLQQPLVFIKELSNHAFNCSVILILGGAFNV